jgi:hypothetical protein
MIKNVFDEMAADHPEREEMASTMDSAGAQTATGVSDVDEDEKLFKWMLTMMLNTRIFLESCINEYLVFCNGAYYKLTLGSLLDSNAPSNPNSPPYSHAYSLYAPSQLIAYIHRAGNKYSVLTTL